MKQLLPLIVLSVLLACNSSSDKAAPIQIDTQLDSLIQSTDSFNQKLAMLDTMATRAYFVTRSEIQELRDEKKELTKQLEQKYPNFQAIQSDDKYLKRINELNSLLVEKEFENTRLRRQIYYDSLKRAKPPTTNKQKIIKHDPILPGPNSLVITLDKKIKGDGDIPNQAISGVYIMPYNKKSKKLKTYANCDMSEINSLGAREALYYNGKYFFNDLKPGKYIIKICPYWGDYLVIDKDNSYHEVEMKVAPPIQ